MPISLRDANRYIAEHHRHHEPVRGCKFTIACTEHAALCGVVIAGRPVARHLDDGFTFELTRLCTDGAPHAASKLIAAATRAAQAMGARRLVSYVLETERGTCFRAAGWKLRCRKNGNPIKFGGGTWDRDARPRTERIVREVGPRYVFVENVAALARRGLDVVLGDLADLGFAAEWDVFSAAEVGAPHLRRRMFILAVANARCLGRRNAAECEHDALERLQHAQRLRDARVVDAGGAEPRRVSSDARPPLSAPGRAGVDLADAASGGLGEPPLTKAQESWLVLLQNRAFRAPGVPPADLDLGAEYPLWMNDDANAKNIWMSRRL